MRDVVLLTTVRGDGSKYVGMYACMHTSSRLLRPVGLHACRVLVLWLAPAAR